MTSLTEAWTAGRTEKTRRKRTPILTQVFRFAGRRLPRWETVRTTVLRVSGLGLIDAAAWQWSTWAGLVVAGVALLLLDMAGDD